MKRPTRDRKEYEEKVGEMVALAPITTPAVLMWAVVIWGAFYSWSSGRLGSLAALGALAGLTLFAILLSLYARFGWLRRNRAKRQSGTADPEKGPKGKDSVRWVHRLEGIPPLEKRTRRDSPFLYVDVSTSDRTADQIGVRQEQKVVPSQHEEDQPALLPFPFARRLSQLESLELTEWN